MSESITKAAEQRLLQSKSRDALLAYVLQDDMNNRLTPRVVDIAYSAFMSGRSGKNPDDGGPCDWFNDTKPMVSEAIAKMRKDLFDAPAPQPAVPVVSDEQIDQLVLKHAHARYSGSQHDWDVAEFSRHGLFMFVRAILALRPAVEPMTSTQRNQAWLDATVEAPSAYNCYVRGILDAERHHGITAKAEGAHQPTKEAEKP